MIWVPTSVSISLVVYASLPALYTQCVIHPVLGFLFCLLLKEASTGAKRWRPK